MQTVVFTEAADVSKLIAAQDALGYGFRNSPLRACLASEIVYMEAHPGSKIPTARLKSGRPPTLIILGDDGLTSPGPAGFSQARPLMAWARIVILHAAGGEARHYEMATDATRDVRRVVMIETTTENAPAWIRILVDEQGRRANGPGPQLRVVAITVPPGDCQPCAGRAPR